MIKKIWHSTNGLHDRFNLFPPKPATARRVFQEEVNEFFEAAKIIDRIQRLPAEERTIDDLAKPREQLALEAADVLVTVIGMLTARGVRRQGFMHALKAVIKKNAAKTTDTHEVNKAGKIARKVKVNQDG